MVSLVYLINFWRTLKMLLINCEISLILIWSGTNAILMYDPNAMSDTNAIPILMRNQATTLGIVDTKLYVPVVTLTTQNNAKLLKQLKPGFKPTISWNRYQ